MRSWGWEKSRKELEVKASETYVALYTVQTSDCFSGFCTRVTSDIKLSDVMSPCPPHLTFLHALCPTHLSLLPQPHNMTTSILRRTTLTTLRISHRPPPLPSLLLTPTSHLQQRTLTSSSRLSATSEVAKNPGSQDFDDLRKNAQEEAKGVAGAVVGAISGGGVEQTTQHVGGLQSDLVRVV